MKKKLAFVIPLLILVPLSAFAYAYYDHVVGCGIKSIPDFIKALISIAIRVGIPVASVYLIWAGFKFLTAQGDPGKLTEAKKAFVWASIGFGVLLASWLLAIAFEAIITSFSGGTAVNGATADPCSLNNLITNRTDNTVSPTSGTADRMGNVSPIVNAPTVPLAPTELRAAAVSGAANQVLLSWSPSKSSGITGYNVYQNSTLVGTTAGTSFQIPVTSAGLGYAYTVVAVSGNGVSNSSTPLFTSLSSLPKASASETANVALRTNSTAPTLTGTAVSSSQVDLAWTAVSGATGYTVARDGKSLATVTGTSYSDTAATSGRHIYTVTAKVGTKKSVSLPVAIAVGGSSNGGAGDTTAPYVPDNLEVLPISATQMNLTWSASEGDSDFTGYKIYRDGVRIGYSVTTSYVDVFSFVPGKTYKYTVAAFDTEDNTSEPSVAVSGVAPAPINPNPEPNPNPTPTPGPTCPAAQTGGSTSGGAGTATFWGDFESGSVTGSGNHNWDHLQVDGDGSLKVVSGGARQGSNYGHIVLADSGCSSCVERAEVVQMHNSSGGIQDENENSGTVRYSFSVRFDTSWRSMVGDNNGAWGIFLQLHGADSLGTNPAFAFDASDVIRFSLRGGNLSQNNGDDYDLSNNSLNKGKWIDFIMTIKYAKDTTGFVTIERRDEGQTNYTTVLNIPNVATLQYANGQGVLPHYMKHGLYRNHENFTSILDVDGFTREVVTGSAPAPSDTQAPSASTGLTATAASSNLVNLSWTAPTDNVGVNCYQIYRGGVQIGTSAGTSYTDTSASGSTTYSYTVVAYDAAGNRGDESAAASVTTPAPTPGGNDTPYTGPMPSCDEPAPAPTSPVIVTVPAPNGSDDTAAINTAIASVPVGGTVLVPAGTYLINALTSVRIAKSLTFKMETGAILKALPNASANYAIILVTGSNVNVIGGTLQGERNQHLTPGNISKNTPISTCPPKPADQNKCCPSMSTCWGQWGHGLELRGSNTVFVSGLLVKDMWGDGIYVGANARNSTFCSVVGTGNRRQGMSIIAASGVLVKNSVFTNTFGHAPQCGFDVEPNKNEIASNIRLLNSQFTNNENCGLSIYAGAPGVVVSGLTITGNTATGNRGNALYGYILDRRAIGTVFTGNTGGTVYIGTGSVAP